MLILEGASSVESPSYKSCFWDNQVTGIFMKTASIIKSTFFLALTLGMIVSTSSAQKQDMNEKSIDKAGLLKMRIQQAVDN